MTYRDLDHELRTAYFDLDEESKRYPLEWDGNVIRFKANAAVRWVSRKIDLNALSIASQDADWPIQDVMTFYRMMGYSLSGFMDIFGDHLPLVPGQNIPL
jgi:hypothetical protein